MNSDENYIEELNKKLEIYFEKKLWPEFSTQDYNRILKKFKHLKRNFGSIE